MPNRHRTALLILLLVTIGGAALRYAPINESLWLDELHTAWTVDAPAGELASRAQLGNNSSLYFRAVKLVTVVVGNTEWSLRLLSLVAGTLLIPLSFSACRQWRCGHASSLLAAALVAIDRHACFYSCEARPYALLQLLAMVHLMLFARLLFAKDKTWSWIAWTLTGICLFQLHCTSGLFIAAEFAAFGMLLWLRAPLKIQPQYLLMGFVVIGTSALTSLGLLQVLTERRENWSHFIHATRQPSRILWLYPLHVYLLVPTVLIGLAVAAKHFIGSVGSDELERETDEEQELNVLLPIILCLTCLLLPVVTSWVLTELDITRLFLRRYLIASSITLAPLSALIVRYGSKGNRTAPLISLGVFALAFVQIGAQPSSRVHEDWRAAIPAINDVPKNEPLLFYSGLIEADPWWDTTNSARREYCEFPLRSLYRLEDQRSVVLLPRMPEKIDVAIADASTAWLLVRSSKAKLPIIKQATLASLGNDWSVQRQTAFDRLTLLKLSKRVN